MPRRAGSWTHGVVMLALTVTLGACGATRRAPDVQVSEGLPPWMEDGDEVRLGIARKWLDLGFTQGAMSIVTQMRASGSTSPELDLIQGQALLAEGVESEAERLLVAARDRMSRDPRPHTELCLLFADQKRVPEAITECQRAVKIDENDAKAWNNLGFLLLSVERLDEARDAAQRAITLDGTSARYRNNLAVIQAALGQDDLANRTLQSTMT
ncbi:MAG: tetratricopeptide repeat protein, partial [Myxococcota bacterium]